MAPPRRQTFAAVRYEGRRAKDGTAHATRHGLFGDAEDLAHIVRHSPTGFNWGYGGSGPADLARSLLADFLGVDPPAAVYQAFKFDVIAGLPNKAWTLKADDITKALDKIKSELRVSCVACLDSRHVYAIDGGERERCQVCGQTACSNEFDGCTNAANGPDGLCDPCRTQLRGADVKQAERLERRLRDKERSR